MKRRIILTISLFAGGGDLLTGLLLIFIPNVTLTLMRVPTVRDDVFVQFVGCFVAAVGSLYFWGMISWLRSRSITRLRSVWEVTALIRLFVGTFVAGQIAIGNLSWSWFSVSLCDWTWCAVQTFLLHSGIFELPNE